MNSIDLKNSLSFPCGEVLVFDELDSTNDFLKHNAASYPDCSIVYAGRQTNGKGRRGHSFFSGEGGAYFSILIKRRLSSEIIKTLTPCVGVCVAESVNEIYGLDAEIKWVNDVLVSGKKICGILCESAYSESCDFDFIVCGVGINVNTPLSSFPDEIRNTAASLSFFRGQSDPLAITSSVINKIHDRTTGSDHLEYMNEYRRLSAVQGKRITVIKDDTGRSAVAERINDDGSLYVRYDGGVYDTLYSGDVSILLQE